MLVDQDTYPVELERFQSPLSNHSFDGSNFVLKKRFQSVKGVGVRVGVGVGEVEPYSVAGKEHFSSTNLDDIVCCYNFF